MGLATARDHVVASEGRRLFDLDLVQPNITSKADDPDYCEWIAPINWHTTHDPVGGRCIEHFRRGHAVCRILKADALEQLAAAFALP